MDYNFCRLFFSKYLTLELFDSVFLFNENLNIIKCICTEVEKERNLHNQRVDCEINGSLRNGKNDCFLALFLHGGHLWTFLRKVKVNFWFNDSVIRSIFVGDDQVEPEGGVKHVISSESFHSHKRSMTSHWLVMDLHWIPLTVIRHQFDLIKNDTCV